MSASAPPPTLIAQRYELQRRLAQGGMAEVWLAVDLTLDRRVAVKWLKPSLATDPVVAERFRREAIAAASLNHPNIVAVHDVFEQDGRQAVVMQLVDGKSLRQLLDTQTRLSPELTCHIGACVATALDHAHRAGFVHRDVKPANIMITPSGRVLLTDFGIAKGLDATDDDLTSENIMMGTAKYLSPEQVRGRRLDGRADLYSLGLVLYECLAGRVPFLGETDADTALARLQRDPTDLTSLRPTLPTGLVDLVHRTLDRNPDRRPGTGAELADGLKAAAREGPPVTLDESASVRSPVTPHAAGRLRRAPSDDRETSTGRQRTPRPTIPGEPASIASEPGEAPPRDPTPRSGAPTHGRPKRSMTVETRPAAVAIGAVVIVAAIVAALLYANLNYGGGDATSPTSILPDDTVATASTPSVASAGPAPASATRVATVAAFDPDGDFVENDELAPAAVDGDPATAWRTVCYSSQYLGGKRGVGLVASFDGATLSPVSVDVASAPYQITFYASDQAEAPTTFAGWGAPLGAKRYDTEAGRVVSDAPTTPVNHVLVLMNELGPDEGCTGDNPYRGAITEIRLGAG
jgi:serine/threonine-protein kinase